MQENPKKAERHRREHIQTVCEDSALASAGSLRALCKTASGFTQRPDFFPQCAKPQAVSHNVEKNRRLRTVATNRLRAAAGLTPYDFFGFLLDGTVQNRKRFHTMPRHFPQCAKPQAVSHNVENIAAFSGQRDKPKKSTPTPFDKRERRSIFFWLMSTDILLCNRYSTIQSNRMPCKK